MPTTDGEQPVPVNIGPCLCSDTDRPHPEDVVYLRAKPDLAMGLAFQSALRQSGGYVGDAEAAYTSVLVRYGVVGWNLRNEDGPIPATREAVIERLGWGPGAWAVAQKARELYLEAVLAPLVPTSTAPQPSTPRTGSMSPNPRSGRRGRTSPSQSSPSEPVAGT